MIKINDLAFSYGRIGVLENISMELEEGKIYGLLGENGVGKTTLLTLLCGLKKAEAGTIEIGGLKPFERSPEFLENQFYLPEEVVPVNAKAAEWGSGTGKFWPDYDNDKYTEILSEFEVEPNKKMNRMSAGQLKKTYIAFALACNVKYLFMDEPTNGLDIPSKTKFRAAVMKYTREDSVIVISTHQVRDLENIIDPIIILDKRDVLLNASLQEVSEKLFFDYGTVLRPDSLYSEQIPGGFIQVRRNGERKESKVDIEALFNTVHRHKEYIKDLFKEI